MSLMIRETYVNRSQNYIFGNTDWYTPYTEDKGKLFRSLRSEYGSCTSRIYQDYRLPEDPEGTYPRTRTNGWVFSKHMKYEDSKDTYIREVWIVFDDRNAEEK